jgi:hypothetical protein
LTFVNIIKINHKKLIYLKPIKVGILFILASSQGGRKIKPKKSKTKNLKINKIFLNVILTSVKTTLIYYETLVEVVIFTPIKLI